METAAQRLCPRDHESLQPRGAADVTYWWCKACHGILIDCCQLEILKLGARRDAERPYSVQLLSASEIHEGTARCSCPTGPLMKNALVNGVTLDTCPACGSVWFDGGEVDRLLGPPAGRRTRASNLSVASSPFGELLEVVFAVLEVLSIGID